jgi:thiamine transport system permease protein
VTTRGRVALLAVPGLFLAALFVWPMVAIVNTGLRPGGTWHVDSAIETLTSDSTRGVLGFTLWQALLSTGASFVLGLPLAWILGRMDVPGRSALRVAVTLPFVLPTVVVSMAFLALAGPRGVLGEHLRLDGTLAGIVMAHAFFNTAVVARVVGGHWARLDRRREEAARVLGASPRRVFLDVTLPALAPALSSAAVLVFLFTCTSYGVVVLLGAPTQATLEVEIARVTATRDLAAAAALALLQLATVAAMLVFEARLRDRRAAATGGMAPERQVLRRPTTLGERLGVVATLTATALFLGGPILVLIERSLRVGDGYGLGWYRALDERGGSTLFVSPWASIRTSLGYAVVAATVAVVVGVAAATATAARRDRLARGADTLLALPLGASAVTVGLGYLVALDQPPLDLRDSAVLVPLAHALLGIPFVMRAVAPALHAVDPRLRQSAAVLGAGPWRVWRQIDLALAGRAILVAAGFAFAISLGEFGATTVLARADTPTVTVTIGRLLGRPGAESFGQAAAMSVVLLVLTSAAVFAADRGRIGEIGSF